MFVFPAAILQQPFFGISADIAVNYGAIGGVIGHEMGHGFDDQGSKSDAAGLLRNWWTDADRKAFDARGDALVAHTMTSEEHTSEVQYLLRISSAVLCLKKQ